MFPNNVSRKGEIFNYSICGPKCPIPFHISLQWPEGKKREGSAPLQEQVITKERERIGLSVIFLPEPLFVNVTYSLSEIIKCKNFFSEVPLCVSSFFFFFFNLLIMLLLLLFPRLINLIFKQKCEDQRSESCFPPLWYNYCTYFPLTLNSGLDSRLLLTSQGQKREAGRASQLKTPLS